MSTQENELYLSESLQYAIKSEKVLKDIIDIAAQDYEQFLRGDEKDLIIFKTDFVEGRDPLTAFRTAYGTFFELDYDELQGRLHTIFDANRVGRAGELSIGTQQILYTRPSPITETLMEFCGMFPDDDVEIENHFELLRGQGNPVHGLRIERFVDHKELLRKFPLAEVWTTVKMDEGLSKEEAIVQYQKPSPIVTTVRRIA